MGTEVENPMQQHMKRVFWDFTSHCRLLRLCKSFTPSQNNHLFLKGARLTAEEVHALFA